MWILRQYVRKVAEHREGGFWTFLFNLNWYFSCYCTKVNNPQRGELDYLVPDMRSFVFRTPLFAVIYLYKCPVPHRGSLMTGWSISWLPRLWGKRGDTMYLYCWNRQKVAITPKEIWVLHEAALKET